MKCSVMEMSGSVRFSRCSTCLAAALFAGGTPASFQAFAQYGLVRLQDFDAATQYASDGLNSSRVCLSSLTPYFEPWGTSLAFAGKVR